MAWQENQGIWFLVNNLLITTKDSFDLPLNVNAQNISCCEGVWSLQYLLKHSPQYLSAIHGDFMGHDGCLTSQNEHQIGLWENSIAPDCCDGLSKEHLNWLTSTVLKMSSSHLIAISRFIAILGRSWVRTGCERSKRGKIYIYSLFHFCLILFLCPLL